jgi:hypothetical protein
MRARPWLARDLLLVRSTEFSMSFPSTDPHSPEELELRFQELRAQQSRAALLFHSYGAEDAEDDAFDGDDPYDE